MILKSSDYTVCRCRLFFTVIHDSPLDSRILEDMLRCCILELKQSSIKMVPYEAFYGRKCRTPLYWTGLSEKKLLGIDLICEIEEKSEATSDRQKSYANLKRKDIEFQVGNMKKVLRFGRKGKLSLRFISLYEVIVRIGPVAYHLILPSELE
ncbi:Retrotransposon gag protein [Gossypium australe]|uniref:Retrotransposon gag protein n=1 Tax=Gossypium australe TaxID=47621 RepID=A0A5B6VBL0_9ROSI|nr:Retrotransposon gag protein [Gossypium australe]